MSNTPPGKRVIAARKNLPYDRIIFWFAAPERVPSYSFGPEATMSLTCLLYILVMKKMKDDVLGPNSERRDVTILIVSRRIENVRHRLIKIIA